ncbi:efflux RND transporter periplasmic adaptor subunit [Legionella cardiaca]|uniref:Efflux RND transporter periplasmic adaptor subunit n=1 Tax=Legionella cardiaca TaxID=1071983 RepID=A0ABY8ASV2_9GAMM|nr:efflux RND transporter periplasmic adaptor subunit [Legionella cardiaca]WED42252.1 efflux RND transporter periplasmic adaptor subunit [Legionella cardiaca]
MKQRKPIYYLAIITLVLLLGVFIYWLFVWRLQVYTNDSYVQGNQVRINALREGFVTSIYSDDTFLVKKGQLLVTLDETDSLIALEKAKAKLALTVREVCQAFHDVFRLKAEVGVRKAEHLKAKQNFRHRAGVIKARGVSLEDYQNASDDLKASLSALRSTKDHYQKILAFVQGSSITQHPSVQHAAQEVRDAWVQLYRCKIYAPVDGLIAQRTVQVGTTVKQNDSLMFVIPLDQMWVNANYKETQLRHIRIGQHVNITSDLYGRGVVFHGKIVGLPGVAGNVFALLPPENLSGNWIKIVQRLPVRVALDAKELKEHPLRIGLSLETTTDISTDGLLIPDSVNSPTYTTDIFNNEETGNRELIADIIASNIDPNLEAYANNPLPLNEISIAGKEE